MWRVDEMKALDFLKCMRKDTPCEWIELDEAIAELEAIQQPKSCEGCKFFGDDRKCWQTNILKYISCERHTFELVMVDRFKPKDIK